MKILKQNLPYHVTIKPTDSDLCCKISPAVQCFFCEAKMCIDCGKAYSGRKHFIIDLCRKRFTPEEIVKANTCYKKRIVNGQAVKGLGNCKICRTRGETLGSDRLLLNQSRRK